MKKLICLVLAALLCVGAVAAMAAPSPTTDDMNETTTNKPKTSTLVVKTIDLNSAEYKALVEKCLAELEKLENSESAAVYFGEVIDSEGNKVPFAELFGEDALTVCEMMPIVVENYDESLGDVKITLQFATPFEKGEEVVVLIGLIDGQTGEVEWYALKGVGTGVNGAVEVVVTSKMMVAIQNGQALIAVLKK
ncbi:MAG: hypothetical protein MR821_10060 [Clostridiales bacterium]|nr:hypothetical protein [Clostridiales bacterium]